ncbi:MAG TPA: YebC/PmpR family DNA-binding transcriptional regulator [Armatimonadota bacterium]|jgi:YebC/PmpR family DNA-binding regulatory protein
MSGHSKWANIQHRKGRQDEKRGKVFAKLSKRIIVAAREGGGDPDLNAKLRTVVEEAKSSEMPKDKIDYAIKRGTGEGDDVNYESAQYEGYGPGGVAMIITVLTDNEKRSVADVKSIIRKSGGSMGAPGSVTWMFAPKGEIAVPQAAVDEETIFNLAVEAGAEEVVGEGDLWEIRTAPEDFVAVSDAVRAAGLQPERAEVTMIPSTTTELNEADAGKLFRMLDDLNDHDDVQQVYANFEVSDEIMEKLAS